MTAIENTSTEKTCQMTEDFWDPEFFDEPNQPKKEVNIKEKENKFKLEIAAPGFRRKDFSINIDNGILNILAEHESEQEDGYLRKEFSKSSFSGAFVLPQTVSSQHVSARYHAGVLTLTLRKNGKSNAGRKQVKVA